MDKIVTILWIYKLYKPCFGFFLLIWIKKFVLYLFQSFFPNQRLFYPFTDCMFITAEPGSFIYTSKTDDDEVCGIFFLAGPDQKVEINFLTFDIPCEHRGLISVRKHNIMLIVYDLRMQMWWLSIIWQN